MLILSRRLGESLIIGNKEVTVTILSIKGNNVRIGIEAPKEVSIHREEIYKKIKDKREANDEEMQKNDD